MLTKIISKNFSSQRQILCLLFLMMLCSFFNPCIGQTEDHVTIKMYAGMDKKQGGYIEMLLGFDRENNAFGYITFEGVTDTILRGSCAYNSNSTELYAEKTGEASLFLHKRENILLKNLNADKVQFKYYDARGWNKFSMLRLKREASINGLYSIENDSIAASIYIFQKHTGDYISFHCEYYGKEDIIHDYSGPVKSFSYGHYELAYEDRKLQIEVINNSIVLKTTNGEFTLNKLD